MSRQNLLGAGLLLGLITVAPVSIAAESPSIEMRLLKLERQVNSQTLIEMLERIDSLQEELQEMRALSEEQTYQLDALKRHQRQLYLDLDRRISQTERKNGISSTATTPKQGTKSGAPSLVSGGSPAQQQKKAASSTTDNAIAQSESEGAALAGEREAYQKAFNLLRQLQYDSAISAFRTFIQKYPKGRYAHIAQYWLGEASYARRDFKRAIVDYQLLIENYPKSPKVAEAMLKMGYSRWELKAIKGAKTILEQLVKRYPSSAEAKQARPLLNKINLRLKK